MPACIMAAFLDVMNPSQSGVAQGSASSPPPLPFPLPSPVSAASSAATAIDVRRALKNVLMFLKIPQSLLR